MKLQEPGQYYDETYGAYELGWSGDHLHFGYWYDDTEGHEDSLLNTTKAVIDLLDVGDDDIILDAGCGTGGSSRYIVDNFGAEVTGIMLSEVMLKEANSRKMATSAPGRLTFHNMDFTDTSFDDGTFSKIFGIESVCHAERKEDFIAEAHRLLRPGGRLAIADGYLTKKDLSVRELDVYGKWLYGWSLPNLETPGGIQQKMREAGFSNVRYIDNSELVWKSSVRMYRSARFSRIVNWVLSKLGKVPMSMYYSARSAYLQHFLVKHGIVGHCIVIGEK